MYLSGRKWRLIAVATACVILNACGSVDGALFGPGSEIVSTAVYGQAKVFHLTEPGAERKGRFANLEEPWESRSVENAVRNGDPVTIVANKAYIPLATASETNRSAADIIGKRDTRDILVLLDLGLRRGADEEFIAVWYQRDVPADSVLDFSNLPIYSIDSWNSDVPPYFRIRIIDVRAERNSKTAEVLKQVNSIGSAATSLGRAAGASLFLSAGFTAAQLVLANDKNRILIDYTFNVYAPNQIDHAGGMPLGVFRKGGMIMLGMPRGAPVDYWDHPFQYDFRRERVQLRGTGPGGAADTPFLMVTVLTAETLVPNIVKRRSAAIVSMLTNPEKIVQEDLARAVEDAAALHQSLVVLKLRQAFRIRPTEATLEALISKAKTESKNLNDAEKEFLLATLRNTTGESLEDFVQYSDWFANCKDYYNVNEDKKRLVLKDPAATCNFKPQ